MASVIPTKSTLIALKRSRDLALRGFDLMDKKRSVLVREITGLIDKAEYLQSRLDGVFSEAYSALRLANITLGKCDSIAEAVEPIGDLSLRYRSVMGVEMPAVIEKKKPPTLSYGFVDTNSALDEAYISFNRAREFIRELAETENAIYRLAYSIKKTQKRANALRNIVIPQFDADIKFITDALEEKEREEFVRLKVIKRGIY